LSFSKQPAKVRRIIKKPKGSDFLRFFGAFFLIIGGFVLGGGLVYWIFKTLLGGLFWMTY